MRQFFYLPFMHSEELADQERCVALARATATTNSRAMPKTTPISSAGSAAFPIATPCWAAPPRRRSRPSSTSGGFAGWYSRAQAGEPT